jgi:hypothetical protein
LTFLRPGIHFLSSKINNLKKLTQGGKKEMRQTTKFLMGFMILLALCFSPLPLCKAMEGPEMVEIDSLAQLYEPVIFDHAMHVDVTEGSCATCHHHTTGDTVEDINCVKCHADSGPADEVSCQGCHAAKRFDADYLKKMAEDYTLYHTDKVGLKAAYHLRCMGCHEEMGAGNGCQDCHPRNDAGDKIFHAGSYAPPENAQTSHGEGH